MGVFYSGANSCYDSLENLESYPVNGNMMTLDDGFLQNFTESGSVNVTLNLIPNNNLTLVYSVIDDGTLRYSGNLRSIM